MTRKWLDGNFFYCYMKKISVFFNAFLLLVADEVDHGLRGKAVSISSLIHMGHDRYGNNRITFLRFGPFSTTKQLLLSS